MIYELQVSLTKDRVWIHASDGSTVARFGPWGIDLHNTVSEQLNGAPECRLCTHGPVDAAAWHLFCEKAKEFWGVSVPYDSIDPAIFALARPF